MQFCLCIVQALFFSFCFSEGVGSFLGFVGNRKCFKFKNFFSLHAASYAVGLLKS